MFHIIRFAHISDSCVNCGQCEENCPMEIPNALFMHSQQVEMEKMFNHVPGVSMELPVLGFAEIPTERERLANTGGSAPVCVCEYESAATKLTMELLTLRF